MPIQTPLGAVTTENHGRYWHPAVVNRVFSGGNQAVVATALPAGLTASYTGGLVLYNPAASTANVAILQATFALIAAQTNAAVIGLGVGYSASAPTGTLTAITPEPGFVNNGVTPQAALYSSATITLPVAPYLARILGSVDTGAVTAGVNGGGVTNDVGGAIILPPGGYACFTSSAAGTASSFFGGFVWEETPLGAVI